MNRHLNLCLCWTGAVHTASYWCLGEPELVHVSYITTAPFPPPVSKLQTVQNDLLQKNSVEGPEDQNDIGVICLHEEAHIHTHFQHDCMVWLCAATVTAQGFDYRDVKFLCSSSNEKILAIVFSTHYIPPNWHCTFPIDFQFKRLHHTQKLLTICPQLSQALHSLYLLRESFGSLWVYKSLAGNFFE